MIRRRYFIIILIIGIIVLCKIFEKQEDYITFIELINDEDERYQRLKIGPNLVNFTKFQYIIKNNVCRHNNDTILGVIIITSYIGHDNLRSAHRQAISDDQLRAYGLRRVFLLAQLNPDREKFITQQSIEDESKRFQDIVQGNFLEAYRNLTYKHVMGLRWAALECSKANFIIKMDDDAVYDPFHLINYLRSILHIPKFHFPFIAGYTFPKRKAIRTSASKWHVSQDEYADKYYPENVSGWLYVTNPLTARKLVLESERQKFFWIDDVWVTGILREKVSIPIVSLSDWFASTSIYIDCCIDNMKQHLFKCEFFVGPNGGDSQLIRTLMETLHKCYDENLKNVCQMNNVSIRKTCVGAKKPIELEHGRPEISLLKL